MFDTLIIAALVSMLGSPSWHTRELAHRALQSRPDAVPMLRACQGCKSPEIAGRATQILSGHYRANAERLTGQIERWPWIDMIPWGHDGRDSLVSDYLVKAQVKFGRDVSPHWNDYRWATRLWVHDLFRAGTSPESVRTMLGKMEEAERIWWEQNGHRYNVPVVIPWWR